MAVVAATVLGSCAPDRQTSSPVSTATDALPELTWLAEFTRPSGSVYPTLPDSSRFGELSGLVLDAMSGQWVSVIDDRDTRVAWLTIAYNDGRLSVAPTRLMSLRAAPGVPVRVATQADLEAIVALPDGTFLMGEEGHFADGEIWQPAILHTTRDGLVTDIIEYPSAFHIRPGEARGLRANMGFESLARLPNGHLVAGLEQPLLEDGDLTSFEHGGRGRLIEFVPRDGGWQPGQQWTYQIDRAPHPVGFDALCDGGGNGLVELLALTDSTLLSMERACIQNPATSVTATPIQIFFVRLEGTMAHKTLVLDMGTLVSRLSPQMQYLDNFEGMAFGPQLPGGGSTLLVVSDDNFRKTQKTSFLLFSLNGSGRVETRAP